MLKALYPRSLKYLTDNLQALVRGRLWLKVIIVKQAALRTTTGEDVLTEAQLSGAHKTEVGQA
ncbi:hypothetical protein Tel_09845 [Candidatus Tenderia electrophaga]|uniref:Uncharacterized protein n=1 Tax=Candidatus Tenderia electrophaga TaxID=1748243 RepID=A0A0S2TE66_9GAMM|nr:hypothetical protein Tel_09845 [Candidatus Tenderia electrophaga]